MTRTLTVAGVSRTSVWDARDYELAEAAYRGEVAMGGLDLDDPTAAYTVAGHKQVLVSESTATPTRLYTGYVADRGIGRDEEARVAAARKWDLSLVDANTLFDDRIIDAGARAAETDVARVQWLLTTAFAPFRATYVAASPTTSLEANDYSGQTARNVLDDCAQQSGKNFYVVFDGTDLALFYDLDTSSNWSSTLRLSDQDSDVDNSVTWAPQWRGAPGLRRDPSELYSGYWVEYAGGRVLVQSGAVASNYRQREQTVYAGHLATAAAATAYGNQLITDQGAAEEDVITATVTVAKQHVNLARAGQRISTKFVHLGDTGFTWRRIARRSVRPAAQGDPDAYDITVELGRPLKTARRIGQGEKPGSDGTPPPACTELKTSGTFDALQNFQIAIHPGAVYTVGAALMTNVPWPSTPCGVGVGGWQGAAAWGLYWSIGVVADASYTHLVVPSFGPTDSTGTASSHSWDLAWRSALPVGEGYEPVLYRGLGVGTQDFVIPRSVVTFGTTNYLVAVPGWRIKGSFQCQIGGSQPRISGQGDSGSFVDWPANPTLQYYGLCSAARGLVTAGPSEAPNGSRTTFTLLGWDGNGRPNVSANGLAVAVVSLDGAAKTVTLGAAPASGTELLISYSTGGT